MRIISLYIRGFGKFIDKTIDFSGDVNVLYGHNEAGKSTIHSFIRAMLYGFERAKGVASEKDLYAHYKPWDCDVYGGTLCVEHDEHTYKLDRDFIESAKNLTITDEATGEVVADPASLLKEILGNMSETAYVNTVSIGQLKSSTDAGMSNELKKYITNMATTGNKSLSISGAVSYLQNKLNSLSSQKVVEAARTYTMDLTQLRRLEAETQSSTYKSEKVKIDGLSLDTQKDIDSTNQKIEVLKEQNTKDKKVLADNHFDSRETLTKYKSDLETAYKDYQASYKKAHSKQGSSLIILAVIALCAAVYVDMSKDGNFISQLTSLDYLLVFYTCALVAIICFVIESVVLLLHNKQSKSTTAEEKVLKELLSSHVDDPKIDAASITALTKKLDEYSSIHDSIVSRETQIGDLESHISNLTSKRDECETELNDDHQKRIDFESKLTQISALRDRIVLQKKTISNNEKLQFEMDAINGALKTMEELANSLKDSYGLYLNKDASELVASITGGIYTSVCIEDDYSIYMNTSDRMVPIESLSSGTMDQIYLALRLASATLLQSGHEALPLIFDDSFVNYDEERLSTALKWLIQSYHGQIIIFTCHKREAQLLDESQIDFSHIEL